MDVVIYLFIPAALVAGVLANISILSPRKLWVKLSALLAATAFMPLAYGSLSELLSRPKPVSLEWAQRKVKEASVLAASVQEGAAIYLWIKMPEIAEPRAYQLPWNKETAKQLQKAQREAQKNKNGVRIRLPFDGTNDPRKRMFYAPPQRPLPPKPAPTDEPLHFQQSQRNS